MSSAVAAIVGTELRRVTRDRSGLFFIFVLPVLIIVIIGATIAAAPSSLSLTVFDEDRTQASAQLVEALEASSALEVRLVDSEDELERDVRTASVTGGLVVSSGFEGQLDSGDQVVLSVRSADPRAAQTLAEVVAGATDPFAARIAAEVVVEGALGVSPAEAADAVSTAVDEVVAIEVSASTVGEVALDADGNEYAYTAPANLVLFVFINSLAVGGALIETRKFGVARRMLAAPITVTTILVGVGTTRFVFALLQSALIVGIGRAVFGVHWGEVAGVVALVVAFSLVGTGAGLLVGALANNAQQASSIGIPVAVGLAMLGGSMWPLEVVPDALRIVGHLTPHAWAMDGWIVLVFDGGGLGDILVPLGVLVLYGVALVGLALVVLRRALIEGR